MNQLRKLLDAASVSPHTAAKWAHINVPSLFDAYNDEEEQDEIRVAWSLANLFTLMDQLKRAPSAIFSNTATGTVDPSVLHAKINSRIATPLGKTEFEEQCGWEIQSQTNYREWSNDVVGTWCPEELKDICDCLNLNWLNCMNGLFEEWKRSAHPSDQPQSA